MSTMNLKTSNNSNSHKDAVTFPTSVDGLSSRHSVNTKSILFKRKLVSLEEDLKAKLSLNFCNVRKAFLDLDLNRDGFIDAEDIAKFVKHSLQTQAPTPPAKLDIVGQAFHGKPSGRESSVGKRQPSQGPRESKQVDFSLVQYLIKVRTKSKD